MALLKEGKIAPDFELPASTGGAIQLSSFQGKSAVVLYFYPKDNTPGCTKEACSFRDLGAEFAEAGAVILGISADSLASHEKFSSKFKLGFPLLSDEDTKVSTAYGAWGEKTMYGRKFQGMVRTTFLLDKEGVIRKVWPKVKVDEHADAVLAFLKSLG
jgi:peroxiredoxin Q/BCP